MSEEDRRTSAAAGITTVTPATTRASSPSAPSRGQGQLYSARDFARDDWPQHRTSFTKGAAQLLAKGGQLPDCVTSPWVVAQLRELLGHGVTGNGVSISGVRAMGTDDLVATLAGIGVSVTAESFRDHAEGLVSGWELSTGWAEQASPAADPKFLGLAACELWTRWIPTRPSVEMLDEQMQDGYEALDTGNAAKAVRIWLRVWPVLLRALPSEIRIFEDANTWFPAVSCLRNWAGDFDLELTNAALDDHSLVGEGLALYERLVERFEASAVRDEFRRQLADYATRSGDPDRGASILRSMIVESPRDAAAYALLSDLWVDRKLPARAASVLEEALAVPVDDAAAWDLRARLSGLS